MPRGLRRIKPISHEDRLSVVEHLGELRMRLFVSLAAFTVAFAFTGWQNHAVLEIVNRPLPEGVAPITLGPAEPFYTTITNSAYAALLISLPVILYQAYAFVLPAFSPTERRVAFPLLLLIPVLFVAGVAFCYFVVLTPAIDFLYAFNADEFNTQLRAREYYSFATLLMLAMGLGFQIPVGILAASRLGAVTPKQLRRNRRYAIVIIAVLASLLPTIDPVTLLLELRGRRRRAVQATYLTLAVLMGGGLVFFGIGGDVSGGLFDAFSERGGGDGGANSAIEKRIERNEKRVQARPNDSTALKELVRDNYALAGSQTPSGATGYPEEARDELRAADRYYQRYLAVEDGKTDAGVARFAVQLYGPTALDKPKEAAEAAQVVAAADNEAQSYLQLVQFAALAGDTRTANLAAQKAVDLAPKDQRKEVKRLAEQLKKPQAAQPQG